MNSPAIHGRDTRLIPTPLYFGGGLAGYFAQYLMENYLGSLGWPANIAVAGFDTCYQNGLASLDPGPQFNFTRLGFGGMRLLEEMVGGNPFWQRDIDVALLKRTGPPVTNDGTLKGPARTEAVILQNIPELAQQAERAVMMCDDPNNPILTPAAMNPTYIAGCGGSGAGIALILAIINYLRCVSPDVAAGREYTQRLLLCGSSFFTADPRHRDRCQGIQAAYLRILNTLLLEGTLTRDHRFGGGVFPGLEALTSTVEDGVPQIPPGVLNEVVILEQRSMNGGHQTLELTREMIAAETYWRSQLPELTTRMRELLNELYDTTRAREARERTAYRFSSFGFRVLEMPPVLGQIREMLLGAKIGEAVLASPAGIEIPAINFGQNDLSALVGSWQQQIADNGVHVPTSEALSNRILTHERHPTPLGVIEEEMERIHHLMPERIEEILGNMGQTTRNVLAGLNSAITERRQFGALSCLDRELGELEESLAQGLSTPALPDVGPLQRQLEGLAGTIEEAEQPEEVSHGIWATIAFAIRALLGADREQNQNTVRPEVRESARQAARLLCERATTVRDHELALRRAAMTQVVLDRLAEVRRELAVQVADINEYVASASERSRGLYERSQRQNAVRMTLLPPMEAITGSVQVLESQIRSTLERFIQGQPVTEALGYAQPLPVDFVQLFEQSPEAQGWIRRAFGDISPQAPIDKAELKDVELALRKFVVYPPELENFIRRLGLDETVTLMPVAGIQAIIIYSWLPGLPARAFQTLRQCEDALAGLEPDDQELCFLLGRYREAPPLLIANRADSDRLAAAALLLRPDIAADVVLPLQLDGHQIIGQGEPHDQAAIFQDDQGVWHVAVNIPGSGERFVRSLRTEDFRVALDIICADADYRDALDAWVRRVVTAMDFGAHDALRLALQNLDTWLARTHHAIEQTPFEDLTDDDARAERVAVEQVKPVVERLHELATEFGRGGRWVQRFKREPRVIPLRRVI